MFLALRAAEGKATVDDYKAVKSSTVIWEMLGEAERQAAWKVVNFGASHRKPGNCNRWGLCMHQLHPRGKALLSHNLTSLHPSHQ